MASLNKVMIIGNAGRDAEMRFTANGTALTNFSVAVNRNFRRDGEWQSETEWFNVTVWGEAAERIGTWLTKGKQVYVEGRLQTRSWDTPEGERKYRTEVIADRVLFLDRAGEMPLAEHRDAVPAGGGDMEPEDIPFE
jgi:single-strand DNA-binding protein